MEYKKFKSSGDPIFISSVTGFAASIGSEFESVPSILWKDAYAAGAISEDMNVPSISDYIQEKKQEKEEKLKEEREVIKEKLREVIKDPTNYVDSNGRPLARKVMTLLGQPTKKELIDSVWDELVSEEV